MELKYFSEWKDQLKELVADRISDLKGHFKSPKCKVLDQPDFKDTLHKLHVNHVLVPADKAANNVIIVCKKYYIDTLVKELGISNVNINNPTTYIPIDDSFKTIVKSHNQFITSAGLERSEEDQNLPYLYWTPKLLPPPQALLGFQFIDFDSLRSACQISKSRQKILGSGQRSTIKIPYKVQVARP